MDVAVCGSRGRLPRTLVLFWDEEAEALLGVYTREGLLLALHPVRQRLVEVPGLLM